MNDAFPAQGSTLSAPAIGGLVRREYELADVIGCLFWRKGMADAYRIESRAGWFFLKVYPAARVTRKDVAEEVRLLLHLSSGGVSVSTPLPRANSEHVLPIAAPEGERCAVLFPAAEGSEEGSALHRKTLGRMVARLHQRADSLEPEYGRDIQEAEHLIDDNLSVIQRFMSNRPDDFSLVSRIALRAKERISLLPNKAPEHGVCHGDLHGGDVRYAPDGEPTIYDFGSSGRGWRALDIGVYEGTVDWMDTSAEATERRKRETGEFLEGYTSVRPLSNAELDVIGHGAAVRHISLMGIVLRYWTDRDGWHWADDRFIDWHMRWFTHWADHDHP
jgi:Ser/Thr protein kinase RdoA (MazF antagonist)